MHAGAGRAGSQAQLPAAYDASQGAGRRPVMALGALPRAVGSRVCACRQHDRAWRTKAIASLASLSALAFCFASAGCVPAGKPPSPPLDTSRPKPATAVAQRIPECPPRSAKDLPPLPDDVVTVASCQALGMWVKPGLSGPCFDGERPEAAIRDTSPGVTWVAWTRHQRPSTGISS